MSDAHRLLSDLAEPRPLRFWVDFLLSTAIGWSAIVVAARAGPSLVALGAFIVASLAIWRCAQFMHEIAHLERGKVPGLRAAWNALIGVPFLSPMFLLGAHVEHHQLTKYGTSDDPEYVPLARKRPLDLVWFMLSPMLAPLGFWLRFAVLAPLSFVIPPLRRRVVERYSSLTLNPAFKRRAPEGRERREWLATEVAACLWAWTAIALLSPWTLAVGAGVVSVASFLMQVKSIAAHRFKSDGAPLTLEGQLRDSVTVVGHPIVSESWGPLGARYHALHHFFPSLPFHAFPEAHARLLQTLPAYRASVSPSLIATVRELVRAQATNS